MITDVKVIQHLNESGKRNDSILVSNIDNILSRPRHLDEVPKPLKLVSVKENEVCGIAKEFNILYNSHFDGSNVEDGKIVLNGCVKTCDYKVYVTMKALVLLGINKNEERAKVCRDLFIEIMQASVKHISVGDMFTQVLIPNGNYYHDVICNAIIQEIYDEEAKVMYTLERLSQHIIERKDFVKEVISTLNIKTLEDVEKELEVAYKEAKKDTKYRKSNKIRGVPKDLIAINYMYYLWKEVTVNE